VTRTFGATPEVERLLRETVGERDRLVQVFVEGCELRPAAVVLEPDSVRTDLDSAAGDGIEPGLAQRLAEAGSLPMFGMPTRVRNLYLEFSRSDREWRTVDRDLDLAIYEFAPGSTVVIDKQEHLCVGFTPPESGSYRSPLCQGRGATDGTTLTSRGCWLGDNAQHPCNAEHLATIANDKYIAVGDPRMVLDIAVIPIHTAWIIFVP
jgi:hypothetical protein